MPDFGNETTKTSESRGLNWVDACSSHSVVVKGGSKYPRQILMFFPSAIIESSSNSESELGC